MTGRAKVGVAVGGATVLLLFVAFGSRRRRAARIIDAPAREPSPPPQSLMPTPMPPPSPPAALDLETGEVIPAMATAQAPRLPAGFSRDEAMRLAPLVAADIASRRYSYNKALLRAFQIAAGIVGDGIYGACSAGALDYWTSGAAPPRLYAPATCEPYIPADSVSVT